VKHGKRIKTSACAFRVKLIGSVLLSGFLLFLGCAPLAGNSWPSNLEVTSRAFSIIDSHYVDDPDFSKLRYGALLGLTKLLAPDSLVTEQSGEDLLIGYRLSGDSLSWKTFSPRPDKDTSFKDVKFVYDVARQLAPEISEEVLESAMLESAVAHMDPQSSFLDRASTRELRTDVVGDLGGIGVELRLQANEPWIVSVIDGTPAQRVGLSSGDRILKIDGISTRDMQLRNVVRLLRGKVGSGITVTVIRDGWLGPKDFNLQRAVVRIPSIQSRVIESGIGLIAIRQFTADVVRSLESVLQSLEKGGLQRLILDLRGNTGGLLVQPPQVAGKFLQRGTLITYTKARAPEQSNQRYSSDDVTPRLDLPLVILVDKNTAAGAELVAGTLQEAGRAKLVGARTHGHATIQTVLPLVGDSMLRLTTARWFTPKGNSVDNIGLLPDVSVETLSGGEQRVWGDVTQDPVLQRSIEIIKRERH